MGVSIISKYLPPEILINYKRGEEKFVRHSVKQVKNMNAISNRTNGNHLPPGRMH